MTLATLAAAAVLGGLYYATATRYYRSSAQLLIRQTGGDVLSPSMAMSESKHETMPTYEQLLHSEVVLEGAVKHLRPEDQLDFQNSPRDKWIEQIAANLGTGMVAHTNIIEVSYRSRNPYVAAHVVQAVVDAYFEFIDRTHKGTAGEILGVLTKEKNEVAVSLVHGEMELVQARKRHGDFGLKPGGETVGPYVQRALKLNEALIMAQEKRLNLQANLASLQTAIRRGEDLQQHVLAVENTVGREMLLAALGIRQPRRRDPGHDGTGPAARPGGTQHADEVLWAGASRRSRGQRPRTDDGTIPQRLSGPRATAADRTSRHAVGSVANSNDAAGAQPFVGGGKLDPRLVRAGPPGGGAGQR